MQEIFSLLECTESLTRSTPHHETRMHMNTLRQADSRPWLIGSPVPKAPLAAPDGRHVTPQECRSQWEFPKERHWRNEATGPQGWHHVDTSILQKAVRRSVIESGLVKHAKCHSFRHSFATHLVEDSYDIRTVKELLGHHDLKPTTLTSTYCSAATGE